MNCNINRPYVVFIYALDSIHDTAIVKRIYNYLTENGYNILLDETGVSNDILLKNNYKNQNCRGYVFFCSEDLLFRQNEETMHRIKSMKRNKPTFIVDIIKDKNIISGDYTEKLSTEQYTQYEYITRYIVKNHTSIILESYSGKILRKGFEILVQNLDELGIRTTDKKKDIHFIYSDNSFEDDYDYAFGVDGQYAHTYERNEYIVHKARVHDDACAIKYKNKKIGLISDICDFLLTWYKTKEGKVIRVCAAFVLFLGIVTIVLMRMNVYSNNINMENRHSTITESFEDKSKKNLNNYVLIEFKGNNSEGTASAWFDFDKFSEDNGEKAEAAMLVRCDVHPDRNLTNGDAVVISWDNIDKIKESSFGKKLEYSDMVYVVSGLTNITNETTDEIVENDAENVEVEKSDAGTFNPYIIQYDDEYLDFSDINMDNITDYLTEHTVSEDSEISKGVFEKMYYLPGELPEDRCNICVGYDFKNQEKKAVSWRMRCISFAPKEKHAISVGNILILPETKPLDALKLLEDNAWEITRCDSFPEGDESLYPVDEQYNITAEKNGTEIQLWYSSDVGIELIDVGVYTDEYQHLMNDLQ